MILIGLGANLPHPVFGSPRATLEAALSRLPEFGIRVARRSRFYESAPEPPSDQPWYVNAVAAVTTELAPASVLERLLAVEAEFGRRRGAPAAARTLDLDLLAYGEIMLRPAAPGGLELPHPRLHLRAFVLLPLAELAPDWRHPALGAIGKLIASLPRGATAKAIG